MGLKEHNFANDLECNRRIAVNGLLDSVSSVFWLVENAGDESRELLLPILEKLEGISSDLQLVIRNKVIHDRLSRDTLVDTFEQAGMNSTRVAAQPATEVEAAPQDVLEAP